MQYVTQTSGITKTPVIIHRAILGSLERMMAILIEHTAGKWPFWLSPRQCAILSVSEKFNNYATHVGRDRLVSLINPRYVLYYRKQVSIPRWIFRIRNYQKKFERPNWLNSTIF